MPSFIVDDDGAAFGQFLQMIDNLICFFGHALVQVFASLIELVYLVALFECCLKVFLNQQIDCLLPVLYASGCIDAGTYFKDNIAHRDFPFGQTTNIDDGFQPDTGIRIELTQPMIGKHAVFSHYRYDV